MNFKDIMEHIHSPVINREKNISDIKKMMKPLSEGWMEANESQDLMNKIIIEGFKMGFDLIQINDFYSEVLGENK